MDDDDEAVRAFTRDGTSTTVLPLLWDGEQARTISVVDGGAPWGLDATSAMAWRLVSELMDQTMSVVQPLEPSVPRSEHEAWEAFQRRFKGFAAETGLSRNVVLLPLRRAGEAFVGHARRGDRPHVVHYSLNLGLRVLRSEDVAA